MQLVKLAAGTEGNQSLTKVLVNKRASNLRVLREYLQVVLLFQLSRGQLEVLAADLVNESIAERLDFLSASSNVTDAADEQLKRQAISVRVTVVIVLGVERHLNSQIVDVANDWIVDIVRDEALSADQV